MNKTFLLSLSFVFFLLGCSTKTINETISKINPLSKNLPEGKKEIKVPSNAPKWLKKRDIKNNISSLGLVKNVNKKEIKLHTQKALIGASQNLTKKIYIKTITLYKNHVKTLDNPHVFDKDIKKIAEHIALKSLTYSKVKNSWLSDDKKLFIQLGVDSDVVAKQIQEKSKLIFKVDQILYKKFLSNRAKMDIIQYLEE